MRILEMTGCFGCLSGQTLSLEAGLNCIYAPNEAGKSTWGQLLRVLLYGLSTRERGAAADKNRYAPWNGARMQGQLLLELDDGRRCVLRRNTARANAPMGEFSCTYEGTATPVEGIDGQNAGEVLLGVGREVFERSAFIRQNAMTVEQDAELERRIAALITSGEEDVSFSESYERLKKQLNRRRHSKTGLLPQLETDIARLEGQLSQMDSLSQQTEQARAQAESCRQQLSNLREQLALWQQLEQRQLARRYRDAKLAAEASARRAEQLAQVYGALPDGDQLAAMEGQSAAADSLQAQLGAAQEQLRQARDADEAAQAPYRAHRLYPADEESLRDRLAARRLPPPPPSKLLWLAPLALLALCAVLAYRTLTINDALYLWTVLSAAATVAAALGVWACGRKRLAQRAQEQQQQQALARQMEEYLPLRRAAEETESAVLRGAAAEDALSQQLLHTTVRLTALLQPFRPGVGTMADAQAALRELREAREALEDARRAAKEDALRLTVLTEHLPEGELPDPEAELPAPPLPRDTLEAQIASLSALQQRAQTQLDTLTGQLRGCGQRGDAEAELAEKRRAHETLEAEYAALTLAMEVLSQANTVLQNRFSPALGARAAEIFGGITGGRYSKVLLSRSFAIEAETADDPAARSIALLSQGTADQLYLAVRLAICEMVLPSGRAVPLVLDDALLSFDDGRMRAALDYLLESSAHRQILLFTCQRREEAYLAGREGVHLTHLL